MSWSATMRGCRWPEKLNAMTGLRHLSVEIELGEHSLSGTVAGEDGRAEPFGSWLELMSAIEARRPGRVPGRHRSRLSSDYTVDATEGELA